MAGELKTYAFINAKLRTRLSSLLPDDFFLKLTAVHTLSDAFQYLKGTRYEDIEQIYAKTGDLKMVELQLFHREVATHREVAGYLEGPEFALVQALLLRYEIENLKHAVRLWFDRVIRKRTVDAVIGYVSREEVIHHLPVDEIINADSFSEVVRVLENTPYARLFAEKASGIESGLSLFSIETELDRFFFRSLEESIDGLREKDRDIARRMMGIEIDRENLSRLVRLSSLQTESRESLGEYIIPGGRSIESGKIAAFLSGPGKPANVIDIFGAAYPEWKTFTSSGTQEGGSRPALLESLLSSLMSREISRLLAGYPFSIGTILAYFFLKTREIRTLLAVLHGRNYNLSEQRIRGLI